MCVGIFFKTFFYSLKKSNRVGWSWLCVPGQRDGLLRGAVQPVLRANLQQRDSQNAEAGGGGHAAPEHAGHRVPAPTCPGAHTLRG